MSIDQRTLTFTASAQVVDRDGDIIEIDGIHIDDFMRNSVLLADHDPHAIMGKVTALWKETINGVRTLRGKAELLPKGVSARADQIAAEIGFGARKGISIGFISLANEPFGKGQRFTAISLLEVSCVVLQSNQHAIITGKSAHYKEDPMHRHNDVVLTLKDGGPNAPSPNLSPAENARLIDATCASIYAQLEPVFAELVRRIMAGETLPTPGKS